MNTPTPKANLPWVENPNFGGSDEPLPIYVGDRFLVAVRLDEARRILRRAHEDLVQREVAKGKLP